MAFPFMRWHSKLDFHLRCYKFSSKQKTHLTKEAGNRVLLPVNCLRAISDRFNDILVSDPNCPLLFKVINPVLQRQHQHPPVRPIFTLNADDAGTNSPPTNENSAVSPPQYETHCGVYEFTADDGQVWMPDWMLTALNLSDNANVTIELLERTPKGQFVRLQPLAEDFFTRVSNPKVLLEFFLRHFVCLTKNEIITINYLNNDFRIRVTEAKPTNVICIVDCDVEVDFEEPPNAHASSAEHANSLTRDLFHHSARKPSSTANKTDAKNLTNENQQHYADENEPVFVPVIMLPESMRKIVLDEARKFAGSGQKLQDKKPSGKKKRKSSSNASGSTASLAAGSTSNSLVTSVNKFAVTDDGRVDVVAAGFRGVPNYEWSPLQCKLHFKRRREAPSSLAAEISNGQTAFFGTGSVLGRAAPPPPPPLKDQKLDAAPSSPMPPTSLVNQDNFLNVKRPLNNSNQSSSNSSSSALSSSNSLYTWHSAMSTHFNTENNNNTNNGSNNSDKFRDELD